MTSKVTIRARRLTALADAAAVRCGFPTWAKLTGEVREITGKAGTSEELALKLAELLEHMRESVLASATDEGPPADVAAVYEKYPPEKTGRKKKTPPD